MKRTKFGKKIPKEEIRRRNNRKKRKKRGKKRRNDQGKRRRSNKDTVIDSSVIISGVELANKMLRRLIESSKKRGQLIFTPQVYNEVMSGRPKDRRTRHRLRSFMSDVKRKRSAIKSPTRNDVKDIPVGGNDKIIVKEAELTGAKYILTMDGRLTRAAKKLKIIVLSPIDYLKMRKNK